MMLNPTRVFQSTRIHTNRGRGKSSVKSSVSHFEHAIIEQKTTEQDQKMEEKQAQDALRLKCVISERF